MSPRLRTLLMTSTALLALGSAPVHAQPTGANVVGGNATVSGAGTNSVIVNQTSDRAIINWNTFNISSGGAATFNQPGSSSITLNRVTGGLGPSVIDGTITANGRVFIINRDGMLFGRGAVINTAGFLATTNDIRNADFMAGRMNFNIPGRGNASIVNYGNITASTGGFAALVAPGVRNAGTISAHLGTVALASGNSFTLDMYGDKLIQVAVGDQIADKVIDVSTGKPLSSLVSNEGTLRANGGRVEITAAAARHIVDSVINNKGVIEANSVGTRAGRIVLGGATQTAGLPKQTIKISGKISATGKDKGQTGGTIQITGEDIQFAAAMLDVSGHSGGGRILVGGDYGGGKPIPGGIDNQSAVLEGYAIPTASTVTVDSATTFNASATANGNGGKVILWSDVHTTFAGTIFARGGELGGNGGFVEVSGKQTLTYSGLVDTRAPNGQSGLLLLDPEDFNIDAAAAATIASNLDTTNVVITTGATGTGVGDITVNSAISWSGFNSLTLSAYRNVVVNANITNTSGAASVILRADNTGTGVGTVTFNSATVSTQGNVSIFYNPVSYTDLSTKSDESGNPYSSFVVGGGQLAAYMLVNNVTDLDNVRTNLTGNYALGRDIDATITATWNDGKGFTPIGNDNGSASFQGIFDGQNRKIDKLTVDSSSGNAGLFGFNSGIIQNVNLTDVTVAATGNSQVLGGLVSVNEGTIDNVTISGNIDAGAFTTITAGGLVGRNYGFISNAHAAVNVEIGNGAGGNSIHHRDAHAGGLVGHNYGTIENSSASGNITGGGNALVGGLVGTNGDIDNGYYNYPGESWGPTIYNSFATGNVLVQTVSPHQMAAAGGLVGDNWGRIEASYATGNVTLAGNVGILHAGGLVGQHRQASDPYASSMILTSYASGNVTVDNTLNTANSPTDVSAGGLVGVTDSSTIIRDVYALGNVILTGVSTNPNSSLAGGGLIGRHHGSLENAYSTGSVVVGFENATTAILGGFIGYRSEGATVSSGYWDKYTSGLTNGTGIGSESGIAGLKYDDAFRQACYTSALCAGGGGFTFGTEGQWFMVEGSTRPFLRSEWSETIRNAHQLQLMAMSLGANYVLANNINFAGQFNASGMWAGGFNESQVWGTRGFAPVGAISQLGNNAFTGSLNGQGFTISGLVIAPNNTTMQSIGLFGTIGATGSVSNLNFAGASVAANIGLQPPIEGPPNSQWIGILAGQSGGTITNVTVDGTVSGLSVVGVIAGGLVGQHGILGPEGVAAAGSITNSWANVNVSVGNGDFCPGSCMFNAAGGLAGVNVGGSSISNSYALGNVTGGARTWAGGLVGQNGFYFPEGAFGTITNSYASGNVTVTGEQSAAGGLVGSNVPGSTITNSQAFGNVAATADFFGESKAGGLVGENSGTITSTTTPNILTSNCTIGASFSCATGNVSVGSMGSAGGLVGSNNGTIEKSFAIGNVNGASGLGDLEAATRLGGLAGSNSGEISDSFARSGIIGSIASNFIVAGGLVGDNSGTIRNSKASGDVLGGTFAVLGGLVGAHFSDTRTAIQGEGSFEGGYALIKNSSASGNVSVGNAGYAGGLVGATIGTIENSSATGAVTGRANALVGGFAGANAGDITGSHATGHVTTVQGLGGGFVGLNVGWIQLSYAKGNVSSSGAAVLGGFVGLNAGEINQAYAIGTTSGAPGGYLGGFVGLNLNAEVTFSDAEFGSDAQNGKISQSYALGPVTGSNAVVAGGFAALNFGSLDQVYAVGHVTGATTRGGLVGANSGSATVSDWSGPQTISGTGTATNSYWDMQTTAQTTSAGGTGMNTAPLSSGLPPGFDPAIWSHHSYPFLVNFVPDNQNTTPGPPVIPPVNENENNTENLQPPDQQINQNMPGGIPGTTNDPIPNTTQFVQQQTQQQAQQGGGGGAGGGGLTTGSVPSGPQPIRLDVGDPDRYFYLPPPEETRLVVNEVVLQMPCNVPQTVLEGILKQHNLTLVASQCLSEGGIAAFRMRHASNQQIAAVIKALAEHQVIAAAQANYTYELTETSVQSATSQQGDPGQYITEKLRLFAAHRIVTGNGIPIAVVDSEIDGAHPDLTGAITNRYDATGVDDSPHAHGTGMAGAIVSHQKLLGVAPGARILAIRAFSTRNTNPESTTYHILRGIDWAVANNVRIINMSFAGPRDPSLERALKAANDKGIVLIAAAGNAGPRAPAMYPAADPHVIAVTATDMDDKLFTGANRGNHVAISAPGVDILVPAPAGEYQVTTGTSVATAHVSGVVALMLERNAKLTPADVRRILIASARRLGPANLFGAGLVDPIKAIEMATPRSAAVPVAPQPPAAAAAPAPAAPAVPKRTGAVQRPAVTVAARP